ncbi:MAG: hypothetical protein K6F34_04860 [Lachnospiraceae bacterium]|nr:hypothetical protein [Lachnospiraceae bacterium]
MTGTLIKAALILTLCSQFIFLPSWASWKDVTITNDTDEGSPGPELIKLEDRKVTAYDDDRVIFESPDGCLVQDMLYSDIDDDGKGELVLLNFRRGRHNGPRPFFVEHDPPVWRQHIYIYDYEPDEECFKPSWMASDIGMDAVSFSLEEDGIIRILNRQGDYSDWKWRSFGLKCLDEP